MAAEAGAPGAEPANSVSARADNIETTWGNGMLILVDKAALGPALLYLNKDGYEAIAAGEVTAAPGINIHY